MTGFVPFAGINSQLAVPLELQAASGQVVYGASVPGDTADRVQIRSTGIAFGSGAGGQDTILQRVAGPVLQSSQNFKALGTIDVGTVGAGLQVAEGTNAKQGTAVLVAGSAVVANTSVTANSRIFLTSNADGGTPGFVRVSARTAGTSFTITSSSGTDTSTIAYEIFEPG